MHSVKLFNTVLVLISVADWIPLFTGSERTVNMSIVLQPPIFDLDSGKELRHFRRLHVQPAEAFLAEKRDELGKQGFYVNRKLRTARLLSELDKRETYSLAATDQNSTEYGFAIRKEPLSLQALDVDVDLRSFSYPI